MTERIHHLVDQLAQLQTTLHQKDFLLTWNQTEADLKAAQLATEVFEELREYFAGLRREKFDCPALGEFKRAVKSAINEHL